MVFKRQRCLLTGGAVALVAAATSWYLYNHQNGFRNAVQSIIKSIMSSQTSPVATKNNVKLIRDKILDQTITKDELCSVLNELKVSQTIIENAINTAVNSMITESKYLTPDEIFNLCKSLCENVPAFIENITIDDFESLVDTPLNFYIEEFVNELASNQRSLAIKTNKKLTFTNDMLDEIIKHHYNVLLEALSSLTNYDEQITRKICAVYKQIYVQQELYRKYGITLDDFEEYVLFQHKIEPNAAFNEVKNKINDLYNDLSRIYSNETSFTAELSKLLNKYKH